MLIDLVHWSRMRSVFIPSPSIDSIWAMMIVWKLGGKIMWTILCCIVYDHGALWFAHVWTVRKFACWFRFVLVCLDLTFCLFLVLAWVVLFVCCLLCYVKFTFFFSTKPRDWLGRTSPKWPILCRVGHKTSTQLNWFNSIFVINQDSDR